MFGQTFWSFAAVMFTLGSGSVYATITAAERATMKAASEKFVFECIDELGITKEEIEAAKHSKSNIDPCFLKCFFTKNGIMDSTGMFDSEKALAAVGNFIKNSDDLAKLSEIQQDCTKVNEADVNDDGCERAMLLLKCFKEHKGEIDIEM